MVIERDSGESLILLRSGLAKVRTYAAGGNEMMISSLDEVVVLVRWLHWVVPLARLIWWLLPFSD